MGAAGDVVQEAAHPVCGDRCMKDGAVQVGAAREVVGAYLLKKYEIRRPACKLWSGAAAV